LLVSCQKDDTIELIDNQSIESKIGGKIEVQNGILSFSNKDVLESTIKDLKELSDEDKEVKLDLFYQKGFKPLYPHFKENDQKRIMEFSEKKKAKIQKLLSINPRATLIIPIEIDKEGELVIEFDDELIADDEFASILNDEREIIVNDTLYKYTYSGLFSVHKNEKQLLDNYIRVNDIEYLTPEPKSLRRGNIKLTSQITKSLPTTHKLMYPQEEVCGFFNSGMEEFFNDDCDYGGGGGGGYTPPVDHTQNLVNLIDNLGGCDTLNGFLNNGFGLFGVTKKCFANFDSKYRTKTKYWKENYLIWNSIGVKVKHQKKGWGWHAKKTDEVALSISQASFKYTIDIPNFPQSYAPQKLYFFEDKVFDSQSQIINYQNQYQKPPFPDIPFISEVVVTEFLSDTPGYDLSVNKMRELFYQGVWQGAKSIVQSYKNRQPKNVTHIIYTPTVVYMNYVDLEKRVANTKKIVNRLDYNFGLGFKFNVNVDAQGNYSTDISNVGDALGNIIIPHLYDYDDVKMDFVGASRKGNTWKGSRIIYTD
ncbi:hypothetical protein, partial [Aquimarina sp. Aq78]